MSKKYRVPDLSKAILFLFALWLLLSIASYQLVVKNRNNRFDFYPRWIGSRSLLQGESPYSHQITRKIQDGMFDRELSANEDQQKFAYMAIIAFQLLPFWLLPFPLAVSIWMGLQLVLLLCLPIGVWQLIGWKPGLFAFTLLIFFSIVIFRYPINSYLIGQFIPFCLASLVFAWWGISYRRYGLASLGLLLSLVRPEVVFIPVSFMLIMSWNVCRMRVIKNLFIGLFALWSLTWALIGSWEIDYLQGLISYSGYSSPVWPPALTNQPVFSVVLILSAAVWASWMTLNVAKYPFKEKMGWLLCISITFSLLTLPQTGNYTLILGLLVVWFIVGLPGQRTFFIFLVSIILSLPWVFHLLPQPMVDLEHLVIPLSFAFAITLKFQFHKISNFPATRTKLSDA